MNRIEQEIRAGGHYTLGDNGVAVIRNSFWLDFSLAEMWGERGVRETYKRAFDEWKSDIKYMTALCITLNHKIWQLYETDDKLARVYDELWKEVDGYILECIKAGTQKEEYVNFNKEEIAYFIQATD